MVWFERFQQVYRRALRNTNEVMASSSSTEDDVPVPQEYMSLKEKICCSKDWKGVLCLLPCMILYWILWVILFAIIFSVGSFYLSFNLAPYILAPPSLVIKFKYQAGFVVTQRISAWTATDILKLAGLINSIASVVNVDEVTRNAIFFFVFSGADGKMDWREENTMKSFPVLISEYLVHKYGKIKGFLLYLTLDTVDFQLLTKRNTTAGQERENEGPLLDAMAKRATDLESGVLEGATKIKQQIQNASQHLNPKDESIQG